MFCHKCGTFIEEGQAFCHKCGTKVVYAQEPAVEETVKAPAPEEIVQTAAETVEPEITAEAPVGDTVEAVSVPEPEEQVEAPEPAEAVEPEIAAEGPVVDTEEAVGVPEPEAQVEAAEPAEAVAEAPAFDEPKSAAAGSREEAAQSSEREEALLDLAIAVEDVINLKCPSCGAVNNSGAKFCHVCGTRLNAGSTPEPFAPPVIVETPSQSRYEAPPQSDVDQSGYSSAVTSDICPYCGNGVTEYFSKTYKEVYNKYFGCSDACCGYICLGPIGILCGFCGAEHSSSERTEKWHRCKNCGKEFRDRKEASDKLSGLAVGCVCLGALFAGIVSIMLWTQSLSWITGLLALGIIAVWVGMFAGAAVFSDYPILSLYSRQTIKKFLIISGAVTATVLAFAGIVFTI